MNKIALECRKDILEEVYSAKSGHIGGSLSCIDILIEIYTKFLHYDTKNPKWEDRDRVILSKGHASPALYAILAEVGFIDKKILNTFRQQGSILQGHPDMKDIPGVDMTTGSLGQGLSAANGMAIAAKMDNKDYKVYCILGDGELQEGQVWEAAMSSAKYNLDNLVVFIDNNGLQIDGNVKDVMNVQSIREKFLSFNWNVLEIDGHHEEQIDNAITLALAPNGKPTAIVANTIKGRGISFMENIASWHGKAPNDEEYEKAKAELEANI